MQKLVLKKMIADGKQLNHGDIVDVSGWKYVEKLVEQRYLTDAPQVKIKEKATKYLWGWQFRDELPPFFNKE